MDTATDRHWDSAAADYDAAKRKNAYYYNGLKTLCRGLLPDAAQWSVLDIGCGTGEILAALGPQRGVGVDASTRMIEVARRKYAGAPHLSFLAGRAEDLSALGHPPFDAVIMCDVLEHVGDVRKALAAPRGVLKPGGRLLVTTSNPRWALPLWAMEKLRLKMPEGPHRWVTLAEIRSHLEALGYDVVEAGYRTLLPVRIPWLSALANERWIRWRPLQPWALTEFALARPCGPRPVVAP